MAERQSSVSLSPAHDIRLYDDAEASIARLFRLAWLVIAILFAGLGGWAWSFSINGAVVAPGKIAVEGKRKLIQHLDGGIVLDLAVRDGDLVEKGALLIQLESREFESERAGLKQEIAARKRQIGLIEEELENLLKLQEKRLVAHSRVAALQRESASLSGDMARLTSQLSRIESRLERVEIRAPAAGRVYNLIAKTVGGVIAPNTTIAEIVPTNAGLLVEARLASRDIDQVRAGQTTKVRMTSFNQRTTPLLQGLVSQVSPDLMRDEADGREYYLAQIALDRDTPERLGGMKMVPGMPAEVLIETDARSVLSYLVKPLTDQFARAFREE